MTISLKGNDNFRASRDRKNISDRLMCVVATRYTGCVRTQSCRLLLLMAIIKDDSFAYAPCRNYAM